MLHSYDHWKTTNPDDEFLAPDPEAEEEIPEPTIEEAWNASRGQYETVVTFASGSKFSVRQALSDEWEVSGENFFMDFSSLEQALNYLTDPEFARNYARAAPL